MTTVRIGALEAVVVSDGDLGLDPARMFARVDEAAWRPLVTLDEHGLIPVGINCLLVRSGERLVLLDTGFGPDLAGARGIAAGRLTRNLAALGVTPDRIDTVVVSHAHGDHAGGTSVRTDEGWRPAFPNATYWLWRGEWEYWMNPDLADRPPFLDDALPPLAAYDRLALADSEVEVAPGIRLISAPGHTPGHLCVSLTSGNEMAVYTGDLFHHASQVEHPEWSPLFDILPEMSAETRRTMFERARRSGSLLMTAHLPTPGIARLPAGGGLELLG